MISTAARFSIALNLTGTKKKEIHLLPTVFEDCSATHHGQNCLRELYTIARKCGCTNLFVHA